MDMSGYRSSAVHIIDENTELVYKYSPVKLDTSPLNNNNSNSNNLSDNNEEDSTAMLCSDNSSELDSSGDDSDSSDGNDADGEYEDPVQRIIRSKFYLKRCNIITNINLYEGYNTIGRDPHSDIFTNDTLCSRYHAVLLMQDDFGELIDFSTNGTYINGIKYHNEKVKLKRGDCIGIGGGHNQRGDVESPYEFKFCKKITPNCRRQFDVIFDLIHTLCIN